MVKVLEKNSGFNAWAKNAQKNNKDKKSSNFFLWMVIFLLSWLLFSNWLAPKPAAKVADVAMVEDISNVLVSKISNDKISANIQGLRISDIELKNYKQDPDNKNSQNVMVLSDASEFVQAGFTASGTSAPGANTVWKKSGDKMVWKNSDGVVFSRTINSDNYLITITDEVKNNTKKDISLTPYVNIVHGKHTDKATSVRMGAVSYVNSDIEYNDWARLDKKSYAFQTVNGFTGFADRYWQTVASIISPDQTILIKKIDDSKYQAGAIAASVNIAAGQTHSFDTRIFAGPKEQDVLSALSPKITGLNETIDYGWFWFLAQPMLFGLSALNGFICDYGLSIIVLTILLRLLMWPLTRKSFTSMIAMQKMQPEMARIQKLYKNDKMRLQMEMMNLYKTHKASPMSGCLPMLLQIPIFFALYKALSISVPMRGADFLWIGDLSLKDPYFILPILMGATMWLQQYLQNAASVSTVSDPSNPMAQTQKMMKWMPLLFTVMFAWMPAGLVLYWTISNVFGIAQMYIIKKNNK